MTWREQVGEGEAERFERYAVEMRGLQQARMKGRSDYRALHTKAHVAVVGSLEVPELAPELRVGPFAEPRSWPLYGRFSNGSPGHRPDGAPDIRGFAMKLVGVPGRKLIPGMEDALTQDFLMIQTPATAVRDPDEFMALIRASSGSPLAVLPRLWRGVGFFRSITILRAFLRSPKVRSLATTRWHTAAPIRFGDSAAKLTLVPEALDEGTAAAGRDGLRGEIVERLKTGPLAWALKAQLFVDEATTPIEDASVVWPEDKAPLRTLGRVLLPRQDITSEPGQAVQRTVESLSFDPWHAVIELRPIGAMMRARAAAYRESVLLRKAAAEPSTVLPAG